MAQARAMPELPKSPIATHPQIWGDEAAGRTAPVDLPNLDDAAEPASSERGPTTGSIGAGRGRMGSMSMMRRVRGAALCLWMAAAAHAGDAPTTPVAPQGAATVTAATPGADLVRRLPDGRAFAMIDGAKMPAFDEDVCRRLAAAPDLSTITFARVALTPSCLDALAALPKLSALTLTSVRTEPATFEALGRLVHLTDLRIDVGAETRPGLAAAFPATSVLVRVALSSRVDGETLHRLGRLPRLTELVIAGSTAEDGLAALAAAPDLERLDTEARSNADLAILARMPKLRELVLAVGSRVDVGGLKTLAKSKTIEEISYACDGPTVGIGELAVMPRLTHLKLVYQTVPAAELARLARAPKLATLDLREADVTDEGLAALAKSRSLKHLALWRVPVSAKVRRLLARSMEVDTGD